MSNVVNLPVLLGGSGHGTVVDIDFRKVGLFPTVEDDKLSTDRYIERKWAVSGATRALRFVAWDQTARRSRLLGTGS